MDKLKKLDSGVKNGGKDMKRYAEDLALLQGLKTKKDYYNYIVESLINGQRQQVRSLFNAMHKDSQQDFLLSLSNSGYENSVKNICIIELTK